jgi:drug/metabolite transporter (DMT)-like permease
MRTFLPSAGVLFSAVAWGLWWLPLRVLADYGLSGFMVNALLCVVGSLCLLPWAWRRRQRLRADWWHMLLAGGLFGGVIVLWNLALIWGEVVRVTLLFYLAPVWSTLMAMAVLRLVPSPLRLLTIAMALSGAGLVLGLSDGLPLPRELGDWLGLSAGVLFAVSTTAINLGSHIDGQDQTIMAIFVAAALSLLLLPVAGSMQDLEAMGPALPPAALIACAWLIPASWLLLWGARHLDPGRVALLLLLEVPTAAISANWIAGEALGWREIGGCLLIIGSGVLEALRELRLARRSG